MMALGSMQNQAYSELILEYFRSTYIYLIF